MRGLMMFLTAGVGGKGIVSYLAPVIFPSHEIHFSRCARILILSVRTAELDVWL